MSEDKELEERMRRDDKQALEQVYLKYKDEFLGFVQQQGLSASDALDVYQDSTIALYQQFVHRQLVLNSGSLKTYLFSIGKFKAFGQVKARQQVSSNPDPVPIHAELDLEEDALSVEQELLLKHFKQLGDSCQRILKLFYYRGLSIKEIVELTDYKDENTVKAHKSRCLKKLKTLIGIHPS